MQRSTPTSLLLRRMTASAVLDALRSGGPMTGSDLIDATGLARPTVHVVCNDLIRLGWIRETGNRRPDSRRGRPARVYEFQSRAGFVLGIDATDRVTVRLADLRGDRVASSSEPLAHVSVPADDRVAAICRQIARVLARAGVEPSRVLAVTVGVPTSVDADGRPLGREAGLPGRDLGPEIGGRFGWPVLVENDANLAAWGEHWRGVAAGVDDLVVLLADERLGSGLFSDGRPVRGHRGGAGELRLLELVERVGSTYGIAWLLRTLGAEAVAGLGPPGPPAGPGGGRGRVLWQLTGGDPAAVTRATVVEAARAGDEVALEVVDEVADRMAHAVAAVAGLLNPELVVIAGAVADAGDLLLQRIGDRLVPDLIDLPPRLAMSSLGDQAVVVGAVRMALDHVEASLLGSPGAAPWKEAPALAAAPSQDDGHLGRPPGRRAAPSGGSVA